MDKHNKYEEFSEDCVRRIEGEIPLRHHDWSSREAAKTTAEWALAQREGRARRLAYRWADSQRPCGPPARWTDEEVAAWAATKPAVEAEVKRRVAEAVRREREAQMACASRLGLPWPL